MINKNSPLLKPYENSFSKPQYNHFSNIISSLQVCEKPSINRLSKLFNTNQSSMNKFLTNSPWEISSLNSIYKKQIQSYFESDSSILIDDSISHRPYAKKVESANYHYDHTNNKQSLGYCIVTSTISNGKNQIPFDMKPYYRKVNCIDFDFKTKNDITKDIILATKNIKQIKYAIFDTWFSNDIVIGACKKAKKDYVTQIKSNRNITINHKKRFAREHTKEIKKKDWKIFSYNNYTIKIFSTSAFISKIGTVHLVFSQIFNEKTKKWSDIHYIISSLLEMKSSEIIILYLNRVGIESFHREAKQNTGLEGYFLRKRRGIEKYLFLVMIAYAHLVLQSIDMKQSKTIGEMCELNKAEVFKDSFEKIQRNPELKDVICMKLAKARV